MTKPMKTFLLGNRIACTSLGLYEAASEDDAVAAMIRDAGYRDADHEAEVLNSTVEKLRDELTIDEVDLAAAIKTIAAAMVDYDRDSSDSDAVRDDADAGDASHWDGDGIRVVAQITVAQEAGVEGALARAIVGEYLPQIRDAYAVAWREAVALDLAAADDGEDGDEDAADGVPLRLTAGQRTRIYGVPHILVGTLGHDPEHGDGTREADLLVEAGILGERVAFREENSWAYPIRIDDCGLAAAACPEVEPYLYRSAWPAIVDSDSAPEVDADEQEIAAVEAAICLESDVTRSSRQDDGSYLIAIPDDRTDDEDGEVAQLALERIARALPAGWSIEWPGNGDSDGDGYSTSDARVYRDDDDA